jgi:UDP-2,3-diacylglucosamine pyrophosphatase LpxH
MNITHCCLHFPNDKLIDGIHYLNSGDLVETCTLIVQHQNGKFEIIYID